MKKIIWVAVLATFWNHTVIAQTSGLGSWNLINMKYTYNQKWSAFAEAQLRSLKFYNDFHYYEYKGGVNYKAYPNLVFTLAMGSYQTYKKGGDFVLPKNNNEFRIWPQINLTQSVAKLKIDQRYRAEFRFTSNGYRNRIRYRTGVTYPFGKVRDGIKPFQVGLSNEIFFTDKAPYFERNRILLQLNYKLSEQISLQLGYLHQFDYRINDETGRDFLL